ncbi:SDR family NAD(P)-dependent oxidoreductase [Humitalea sp. 24SJ18S-53]|uniref:SDR family NAD(P)-dependent oxidoreductase n=1 Tax=Humitalea sp. 24SJ18S-53 TaxID=3422307 RepID=UPI003D6741D7
MIRPLLGQVALVTGASRGIGAAVAVELARAGAQVVLVARTQGGLEETDDAVRAAGSSATLLPLDLIKDAEQIDMLGPSIVARFGRLDILVHAAGALGSLTPVAHIQPKDWAEMIAVNMASTWRLIRTCDPPMRAAPAGRAVVITTGRIQRPKAYWGGYGATKAGQAHLVQSWALETHESPLRVNLYDPGIVATKMRMTAMPGEDQSSLAQPADVAPEIVALCLPTETRQGETVVRPSL